jgi:hypothetical protein
MTPQQEADHYGMGVLMAASSIYNLALIFKGGLLQPDAFLSAVRDECAAMLNREMERLLMPKLGE